MTRNKSKHVNVFTRSKFLSEECQGCNHTHHTLNYVGIITKLMIISAFIQQGLIAKLFLLFVALNIKSEKLTINYAWVKDRYKIIDSEVRYIEMFKVQSTPNVS